MGTCQGFVLAPRGGFQLAVSQFSFYAARRSLFFTTLLYPTACESFAGMPRNMGIVANEQAAVTIVANLCFSLGAFPVL